MYNNPPASACLTNGSVDEILSILQQKSKIIFTLGLKNTYLFSQVVINFKKYESHHLSPISPLEVSRWSHSPEGLGYHPKKTWWHHWFLQVVLSLFLFQTTLTQYHSTSPLPSLQAHSQGGPGGCLPP
jgi:hypothetical protein